MNIKLFAMNPLQVLYNWSRFDLCNDLFWGKI